MVSRGAHTHPKNTQGPPPPPPGVSFSNDDGDGNENVKKSDRLNRQNNNFVSTSRFSVLYVYLLSLHDYDVKIPYFTFYGER